MHNKEPRKLEKTAVCESEVEMRAAQWSLFHTCPIFEVSFCTSQHTR